MIFAIPKHFLIIDKTNFLHKLFNNQLLILSNMDEYYLSESPERFLMAQHYHSSLDTPNLDNVEAKLYAARQKNHQLAMTYFKNKYGSTVAYQQFAKTHNLGYSQEVNKQAQDMKKHLERKAREIQYTENQKYKQKKAQDNIRIIEQDGQEVQYIRKPKNTQNKSRNPWNQPKQVKKGDIKQRKVNFQENSDHVVQRAHNKNERQESEFVNEFKKYLVNKQSLQSKDENFAQTFKSTFTNKSLAVSNLQKSKREQQESPKKQKSYEEELVKKIFIDITGLSSTRGKVQKLALVEYLVLNKKILKVIGINEEELNTKLLVEHETKEQSNISYHEVLFFILKTVGKQSQINFIKQDIRQKSVPSGCMLSQGMINYFQETFNKIDKHCDLIIKRVQFIGSLASDPTIKKQLNLPAVYQGDLDKHVSLRRIFERIQMQAIIGSEQQKKVKQYISWSQFLEYFRSGFHDRSKYDLMILVDSLRKQEKFGLDLPDIVSEVIAKGFKKIDKGSEYFNIYDVLQQISKNPDFQHEKFTLVRSGSEGNALDSQTFEDVLTRIKEKGQQYMTVKEFLQYFSVKGKPVEEFQQAQNQQMKKNFSGVKVKFAEEQHMRTKNYEPQGYDSDPQMYSSNLMNPKSPGKKIKEKGQTSKSFHLDDNDININRNDFKITVPVPFKFEERQKNKEKKKVSDSGVRTQMSVQGFKAKQIPAKVKDPNLYERMLDDQEKRIEERRKNSMIMTLAAERPFSFLNRKVEKKTRKQRQQFNFKAKPIPWFCTVDLLTKKKEVQISRNQKIAKQAQESLAKAKLPPRMQRDYQEKLAKKGVIEEQDKRAHQLKVYRKPPNFDKIHQQFEEAMDRKRKQNKVTQPQQFKMSKTQERRPKSAINKNISANQLAESLLKNAKDSYKKNLEPKQVASSTLKFTQHAEKRRCEMEEKRKKEEKIKKQDEQRQKIDQQLKKKVCSLAKNKENKQKELLSKRQQELAERMKNFISWKKQCVDKGRQQPLLVERPLKRDEKIQKMKKLYQISQTLKSNGIKGKDHDVYFKRDELLMLQDYQALKDKF